MYNIFSQCSNLTSVTIGSAVTSIGTNTFDGVDLHNIISLIENPFNIYSTNNPFNQYTYNNATLYVPTGTIDKYKAKEGWRRFYHIVEGIPAGINVVENTKNNNVTIYNLNGIRQPEPKKGINIVNGKKVVVK